MYFALSKILWFVAGPVNLLALAALAGALLAFTRYKRLGRWLGLVGVTGLVIVGFSPLGTWLLLPLEERFPAWREDGRPVAGIVVLGGSIDPVPSMARGQMALNESAERLIAMADLARRFPATPVVFTGGSGELLNREVTESAAITANMSVWGLPAGRVTFETRSRNTYENALFTRDLLKPGPGQRYLLVTSAYHMPRSMALFRAAGFDVVAYPVDFRTTGPRDAWLPFVALSDGIRRTETASREWIGIVAARLLGHTAELFPAP